MALDYGAPEYPYWPGGEHPWAHLADDNYAPGGPQPATLAVPPKGSIEERAAREYAQIYGSPTPAWAKDVAAEAPPAPTVEPRDAALAAFDEQGRMAAEAEARRRGASPYDVAGALGSGAQASLGDAYAMAQAAGSGTRRVTVGNAMHAPVYGFTGATRRADSDARDAVVADLALESDQARMYHGYLLDERARLSASADAQYDAEQERAQQALAQERRAKAIQIEVDRAADKFSKTPPEDSGRFWASRKGWQKFALALSAAMKGWLQGQGYSIDPMQQINEGIRLDLEEQRSNRALASEKLTNRQRQAAEARSSYAQLLEQFGDERLAENMIETARLKEAQARLASMTAGMEAERLGPAHKRLLADLDSEIAKKELERRTLEIKNPATITKTVKTPLVQVVGPGGQTYLVPRAFAMQQATADAQHARALQMKGVDVTADAAKASEAASATERIELAKIRAKAASDRGGAPPAENMRFVAKETATAQRVRTLAEDMLKMVEKRGGDVPGVGWYVPGLGAATHQLTEDARRFRKLRDSLAEYDITDLTGAVSSPKQQQVIEAFLAGSETEIQQGLREIQRAMDTYISTIEGADPRAAELVRRHAGTGKGGWRGADVASPDSTVVREDL